MTKIKVKIIIIMIKIQIRHYLNCLGILFLCSKKLGAQNVAIPDVESM